MKTIRVVYCVWLLLLSGWCYSIWHDWAWLTTFHFWMVVTPALIAWFVTVKLFRFVWR